MANRLDLAYLADAVAKLGLEDGSPAHRRRQRLERAGNEGLDRGQGMSVLNLGGEHQDWCRSARYDLLDEMLPVAVAPVEVEDHDVGRLPGDQFDGS